MRFLKLFHIQIVLRITGIVVCVLGAIYLWLTHRLYFSAAGVFILAVVQLWALIRYIEDINSEVALFITAVKNRDNGVYFDTAKYGPPFSLLFSAFNDIIQTHKTITIEKEAVFQLMNSTLEKAPFGMIVIEQQALYDADNRHPVLFINSAVESILRMPLYNSWNSIAKQHPQFAAQVKLLASGGKQIIENFGGTDAVVSLETQLIYVEQKPLLIISFQDIKAEMEQKEMEAWSKLIHVLTHEILNSITPIHSLSFAISQLLNEKGAALDEEDVDDLKLGAATIQKRSDGLMQFVRDYRHVAAVPVPVLETVAVNTLLQQVKYLMQPLADKKQIQLVADTIHPRYAMQADEKLLEQVLINLVTNSIHALDGRPNGLVQLLFTQSQGMYTIEVKDNGKGIPAENMDKIFVPFFTTRPTGSGIGLTLSRNIMKLHNGWIEVESKEGVGTTFRLVFAGQE
ncbi:sensor histidine kinase [Deminuibacter soli]|uniref:histidine kinase n=1 Tax=Deminuibacter soli TaxID=2291815 RepID=A0A3E1NJC8_9BACT|nr:HAMP domain-containing sensor histidine kinase [Deminuibacter soli]RFM28040.1 sensor histidine kinase [Deminuibacter soli]